LDPSTVAPVLRLKETLPTTVKDVRKLMGFLIYYRRYIENFSSIAKPIYDLLKSDDDNDNKVKAKGKRGVQPPPNQSVTWTTTHQSALEKHIGCLIDLPLTIFVPGVRTMSAPL
jgi:hypothetical protein